MQHSCRDLRIEFNGRRGDRGPIRGRRGGVELPELDRVSNPSPVGEQRRNPRARIPAIGHVSHQSIVNLVLKVQRALRDGCGNFGVQVANDSRHHQTFDGRGIRGESCQLRFAELLEGIPEIRMNLKSDLS